MHCFFSCRYHRPWNLNWCYGESCVPRLYSISLVAALNPAYKCLAKIHSLCVFRTDVNYHDMEEIEKMQSIPDLERFLPPVNTRTHFYLFNTIPLTALSILSHFFSSVTVLYAECLVSISPNQREEFCWSCMSRRCFFAENATLKRNKHLLSCPSSRPHMKLT